MTTQSRKLTPRKITVYESYLVVTGRARSMFDMLRYDCCFPATGEDAARMEEGVVDRGDVTVALRRLGANGRPAERARWTSFGFAVLGEVSDLGAALDLRRSVSGH